jgi:thioesterase domain-containing protein
MSWTWLYWAGGGAIALGFLVYGIGAALPAAHVARAEALIAAPPDRVASLIRDVEAQPRWRRGVTAIEVKARQGAALSYVEHSRQGAIAYSLVETQPGRDFRSTIDDPKLPFGGHWTIAIAPEGEATRVRIEEHGIVRSPVFRFVSTLILGHEATMRAYLDDLGKAARR